LEFGASSGVGGSLENNKNTFEGNPLIKNFERSLKRVDSVNSIELLNDSCLIDESQLESILKSLASTG